MGQKVPDSRSNGPNCSPMQSKVDKMQYCGEIESQQVSCASGDFQVQKIRNLQGPEKVWKT